MLDILVVEDNKEIAGLLSDFLEKENYVVGVAGDGEKALRIFEMYGARLVILDVNLPGTDGFFVCKKIREKANTPVIIASARTDKEDQLRGLELGADDYIEKPFDIDILIAKVRGIFKRKYELEEIHEGNLILNTAAHTLKVNGADVTVTGKEFDLLRILIENKGTTMKKEYLFNTIWGSDSDSEPQTLNVHINGLRKKIEENPKKPVHIVTVWGVGYRYE